MRARGILLNQNDREQNALATMVLILDGNIKLCARTNDRLRCRIKTSDATPHDVTLICYNIEKAEIGWIN